MIEKLLLGVLDGFRWLFKLLGVDYGQLHAIVALKLKTDNRRQHISYGRRNQKERGNAFLMTLVVYGIIGAVVALVLYVIPSFMLSMVLFFSYVIVVVSMTLITDFSSILLDTSDNTIILPRPVDGRTLFIARITHIMLYLGQLGIGLALVPAAAVFAKYGGIMLMGFLVLTVLSIMTAVFLTNAIYLVILQFSSEEKLKNIINYVQIGMAVGIMGAYQILPRIMERLDIPAFVFKVKWWSFLLPPIWMAASLETIELRIVDAGHMAMVMCAVVIPPLGLYLVNKYLTPVFSRKLGVIGIDVQEKTKPRSTATRFADSVSRWVTQTPAERGAFSLVFKTLGRDRKIKLKIYPAFGYIAVFGVIFIMRGKEAFGTTLQNLPDSQYHLALLYLTFMILQVAFHEIPYSDDFKASWVYHAAPVEKPGEMLSGMIKALFVKLFIPGYVVVSILILAIWGTDKIGDILFGAVNNYLMLMTLAAINVHYLPLAMAPDVRSQSGNVVRSIVTFAMLGILGGGHFLLTFKPNLVFALLPVQLLIAYFLHRAYKQISWRDITL